MLHRFRKIRNVPSEEVLAGESRSNVKAIREVEISINALGGKIWKVLLTELCYISNFMTNIAAPLRFRAKGVYFDDRHKRLYVNNRILGWVKHLFNHDILEDNTDVDQRHDASEENSSAMVSKLQKSETAQYWHKVLAYANHEVIQHLQTAAEGVRITDATIPKTHECETCALFKLHRIISQPHNHEKFLDQLFFRVTYDLIAMPRALNGHEWVSHLACSYYNFNIV